FLVEPEHTRDGTIEDTAVIFLTNRECPFRCLMCDLWKNTTDRRVADGAIAGEIAYALARVPPARHVELYNAGNFFDVRAIPTRAGNGALEEFQRQGQFTPPRFESLEEVLDYGLGLRRGRVFADLWDAARFYSCERCGPARAARLHAMNLTQRPAPPIACSCG